MDFMRIILSFSSSLLYLLCVLLVVNCDLHAPCYSCVFYKLRHSTRSQQHLSADGACLLPCYCDVHILNCAKGVKIIQDGCGCCNICTRQLGETCNRRLRCDETQGLFCNVTSQPQKPGVVVNGTCAVRRPKPCHVDGQDYDDGEQFKPNCSRLCTCRDGGYGCVSLCPHEEQPPEGSCSHPQLTTVPGQCCREWTCDAVKTDKEMQLSQPDVLEPTNIISPDQNSLSKNSLRKSYGTVLTVGSFNNQESECQSNATAWSPCSVTCGIGLSVRMTTDLSTCQTVQQTQICNIRPCDQTELFNDVEMSDNGCSATVKSHRKQMIVYEGCHSSQAMHIRFCGYCGENFVCLPRKVKTVLMDFDCPGNKKQTINFMWIRKCHCIKSAIGSLPEH